MDVVVCSGCFAPCHGRLVSAEPIHPNLLTSAVPRDPPATHIACQQAPSAASETRQILRHCLECLMGPGNKLPAGLVQLQVQFGSSGLVLTFFFFLSVFFFKSALASDLGAVAHLRC